MDRIRPHVVVIGGGFGGISAARALKHAPVDVTLVDRENYQLFQPLLYQVATAELSETDVAMPLRTALSRQRNVRVLLGEAGSMDFGRRRVVTDLGEIEYDFLVLATGAEPNYFGRDSWEAVAPSPKSLPATLEIRRRLTSALELADSIDDPAERRLLLQFVIVGGGATGVEFAGEFAAARSGLTRSFPRIDPRDARIHLVESHQWVLSSFPEDLSKKTAALLERRGVILHLGKRVAEVDEGGVNLNDGTRIDAATVIWTAGVRPTSLAGAVPGEHRGGRVVVTSDLSLPGYPEVFAIGDMADFRQNGTPLPAVSAVAIQGGRAVARSIVRTLQDQPREPFHYFDKGSMAQVGHYYAVARIGRLHLSGFIAWLLWGVVHVWYLSSFRNRIAVLFNWAWFFLTRQRPAPIVIGMRHPIALPGCREPSAAVRG